MEEDGPEGICQDQETDEHSSQVQNHCQEKAPWKHHALGQNLFR